MNINSRTLAVILVVIMFGGIAGSSALGWWQTSSSKVPMAYTEGEFAGQANPADIRGSYTFGDISRSFPVPSTVLAQAFGVQQPEPDQFQVKELESIYADSAFEIGTASVRLFVALYSGLPYDLSTAADTYLPASAVQILKSGVSLSEEQIQFLDAHTAGSPAGGATRTETAVVETPVVVSETLVVKGKTTFGELISWGVEKNVIESIIGKEMPSPAVLLKDFASENGLDFESLKSALQAEVDKVKK